MRRLDKHDRLDIVASQALGPSTPVSLSPDEAEAAAWTVTDDGVKVGGARAIALALAVGRCARWPTVAWRVPLVPSIADALYGLVARNRHRLPGDTPWCMNHEGECSPQPG